MSKYKAKLEEAIQNLTTKILQLELHLSSKSSIRRNQQGKIEGLQYAINLLEQQLSND